MKISKIELPKKAPETFEELCRLFLPRPIHDEAENEETGWRGTGRMREENVDWAWKQGGKCSWL